MELTWSSLTVTKQELDSMKDLRQQFHQIQEVNQKLTESAADSRGEIRDLVLAMKDLEMQNIKQKKLIEEMARRMTREIKRVENKVLQVEVTRAAEEAPRKPYTFQSVTSPRRARSLPVSDTDSRSYGSVHSISARPPAMVCFTKMDTL